MIVSKPLLRYDFYSWVWIYLFKSLKPAKPRNRDETIIAIKTQFVHAETVGTAKKIKEMRTESGVKDTYQLFFVNRLLKRRQNSNAEPLQASQSTTDNPMSPVWRIRGKYHAFEAAVDLMAAIFRPGSSLRYSSGDLACCPPGVCQVSLAGCY